MTPAEVHRAAMWELLAYKIAQDVIRRASYSARLQAEILKRLDAK